MPIREALRLPKIFIFTAFFNFVAGATLGGIMAGDQSLWPALFAYHAELNPYGWLTMLIYGMTYVVLFLALGLKLPRRWQGILHVAAAEGSIILIALAVLSQSAFLDRLGLIVQAVTPLLFMTNILTMVIVRKKNRGRRSEFADAEESTDSAGEWEEQMNAAKYQRQDVGVGVGASWKNERDIIALFGVVDELKATDNVAQRGTDVSLMIFIVAGIWMAATSLIQPIAWPSNAGTTPQVLTYYGWIAGTVLAVAMHLYPRLFGVRSIAGWYAQTGQIAWGAGVVLLLAGNLWTPLGTVGSRAVGLGILWQAVAFLVTLKFDKGLFSRQDKYRVLHVSLWIIAWFFAVVLGVLLLLGISPLSLAVLHLLFLGWITTLVYSIGYRLFPLLLGKTGPAISIAVCQGGMAVVGAILMPLSFIRFMHGGQNALAELAVGGILAALGAIVFVLQWVLSPSATAMSKTE